MNTTNALDVLTISEKEECLRAKVYIRDFSSATKTLRLQALGQIKRLSKPVAKVILKMLLSKETEVLKQVEVLGALATCNGKADGDRGYLNTYFYNPEPQLRVAALRALSKYEDEASFETLSLAIKDSQPDIRKEAINLMVSIYGQRALPLLLHLLRDLDDKVRSCVISLCATLEAREAVPVLITMLTDENSEIQKEVSGALKKITKESKAKTGNEWNLWWMDQYDKSR